MTLRSRITLLSTGVLLLVLALAAFLIVTLVDRQLRSDLVAQNDVTLEAIASQIKAGTDPTAIPLPLASDGTEFTISTIDGTYVNSSVLVVETTDATTTDGGAASVGIFDDDELDALFLDPSTWSTTSVKATSPGGTEYVVSALSLLSIVERSVSQVRSVLWFVIPGLAVAFAAIVWTTTGRILRPVDEITARAETISVETLHERVEEPDTDDEIGRLARTLNSMLDRLDRGARLQKEFVSDASHELKTPLTVMLGEARLASTTTEPERLRAANALVIEHGVHMSTLIDDLLDLARVGEGALRRTDVDLDDLLREQAVGRTLPVDTRQVVPVRITGDERSLQRLFRNLVDNASRYADTSVQLACSLTADRRTAIAIVDDDGPGIPLEQRERVFDRFARLDTSRARDTGGSGLGLAIARAIVEAHGGTISIGSSPLGGARVTVALPV